jgi:hypothetical protein
MRAAFENMRTFADCLNEEIAFLKNKEKSITREKNKIALEIKGLEDELKQGDKNKREELANKIVWKRHLHKQYCASELAITAMADNMKLKKTYGDVMQAVVSSCNTLNVINAQLNDTDIANILQMYKQEDIKADSNGNTAVASVNKHHITPEMEKQAKEILAQYQDIEALNVGEKLKDVPMQEDIELEKRMRNLKVKQPKEAIKDD